MRVLGDGMFGHVVLARDPVLGRQVAVKTLRDDVPWTGDLRAALSARMKEEACAIAALSHPNIVALHDMGEDREAGVFLAFEYVDGHSLRERLRSESLAPTEIAKLARELGGALSTAHDAGLVHRDVKPENVLLGPTGGKLTDFGLSRPMTEKGATPSLDLVTPAYAAPEVLTHGQFSPASDQFSLAATLYEALSGRRAFPGADPHSIAIRIAEEDPPLVAHEAKLEPRVDGVFMRGLAKEPERRFNSCRAFGEALAVAIEQSASWVEPRVDTIPPSRRSIVPRATRRMQNMVAGAATVAIVALLFFGSKSQEPGVSLKSVAAEFAAVLHASRGAHPPPRVPPLPPSAPREVQREAPRPAASPAPSEDRGPSDPSPE